MPFLSENALAQPPEPPYTASRSPDFMFAVVTIAGFQERVQEGDTLDVPLQDAKKGDTLTFTDVMLLTKDGGELMLGKPFVAGVSVQAEVVEHGRGDKIRVYRMRRRKRFQKTKGHRQDFTTIKITKIAI